MADQNITALPVATSPTSSDQLLLVGATEEKLIDYDKLADAILTKLTSKQYTLDQGTKTLPAALNELNSKAIYDIYRNYSWKTSHSIDVSNANTLLLVAFGGTNGNQNIILPLTKTGTDAWLYNAESISKVKYTFSCKNNVITITNTATFLCFLIKVV